MPINSRIQVQVARGSGGTGGRGFPRRDRRTLHNPPHRWFVRFVLIINLWAWMFADRYYRSPAADLCDDSGLSALITRIVMRQWPNLASDSPWLGSTPTLIAFQSTFGGGQKSKRGSCPFSPISLASCSRQLQEGTATFDSSCCGILF